MDQKEEREVKEEGEEALPMREEVKDWDEEGGEKDIINRINKLRLFLSSKG